MSFWLKAFAIKDQLSAVGHRNLAEAGIDGSKHPERDVAHRWVRQRNLKLITSHNANAQGKTWNNYTRGDVLYDVVKDPGETNNLIDDPQFKVPQQTLRELLNQWWNPES